MPVPSAITDLSTTPASNSPAGSEAPTEGDNHLRTAYSFIRTLYDTKANAAELGTTSTTTQGAGLVSFLQGGTGAIARTALQKMRDHVTTRDFCATVDGTVDNTTELQAAINYAQDNRLKLIISSVGTSNYKTTAPLVISKPVTIEGEDSNVTILGTGLSAGQFLIDVDGTINPNLDGVTLERLVLRANNNTPNLVKLNNASHSVLRDITLYNGSKGLVITGNRNFSNVYERVIALTKFGAECVKFESFSGGGQHVFQGCVFYGQYGMRIDDASEISGLQLFGCNFELSDQAFFASGDIYGLAMHGNRFEKNGSNYTIGLDPAVGNVCEGVSIHGNFFETDGEPYAILIGTTGGTIRGISIQGNYARDYSQYFVRLNGAGEGGIIAGNYINAIPACVSIARPGVLVTGNYGSAGAIHAQFAPPLTAPTLNAASTDLASVVALCNQIRSAVINAGLAS